MTDVEFDTALIAAAFELGAAQGWSKVSAAAAARRAGLDLNDARMRFGSPATILKKFGQAADVHAITGALTEGAVRDRLFDVLLRRFDFLQLHRAGVLALLKFLPLDVPLAIYLAHETTRSMGWLLEAAGLPASGLAGELKKNGLSVVWAVGVRAWVRDESADLTATMAAVDTALHRADALLGRFFTKPAAADSTLAVEPDLPFPEPPSGLA